MSLTLQDPTFQASVARNIHLYDDNGTILGGIYQNGSLTNKQLYDMCAIFLVFTPTDAVWYIFTSTNSSTPADGESGLHQLACDASITEPGRYIILGPIKM